MTDDATMQSISERRTEGRVIDPRDAMVITVREMVEDPAAPEWARPLLSGIEEMDRAEVKRLRDEVAEVQDIMLNARDDDVARWAQHESVPPWGREALAAFVETKRGFARYRAWADVQLLSQTVGVQCLLRGITS